MDTRKRNLLIGAGVAILVVVILTALIVSGGSNKNSDQDEATTNAGNTAAVAADATAKGSGTIPSSGDGTASNQVDASEVFGDSPQLHREQLNRWHVKFRWRNLEHKRF